MAATTPENTCPGCGDLLNPRGPCPHCGWPGPPGGTFTPFSSRRLVEIDGILRDLKAELASTFGINVNFLELERDAIRRYIGEWFIRRERGYTRPKK